MEPLENTFSSHRKHIQWYKIFDSNVPMNDFTLVPVHRYKKNFVKHNYFYFDFRAMRYDHRDNITHDNSTHWQTLNSVVAFISNIVSFSVRESVKVRKGAR